MRILILILLTTFISFSCKAQDKKTEQNSGKYIVTYQKGGKTITDTVAIRDTTLQNELNRMMTDPNYKPKKPQNDTVFNSKGYPTMVKLVDDIFGASIHKFEYDNMDRLIKITGFDNQNNIKPFYHDIAIQINKYDPNGNLVEIRYLQENGELISSEFEDTPIIRKKYNDKNQLIEESFLDEKENLRTEFSIIKYEYNDKGEVISESWYNAKGKKTNNSCHGGWLFQPFRHLEIKC
jgi:hypothetical protein